MADDAKTPEPQDLVRSLRFTPSLHRTEDPEMFGISREDLMHLLHSRTHAANFIEQHHGA